MAIEAAAFKAILSRWSSGVTVLTALEEGEPHGMTASSFSSLSLDPPLVLVCVAHSARIHPLLREQRAFGIHMLDAGMEEISNRCAGFRGPGGHRLVDVPSHVEVTGAPILDDCLAWMDCSLWGEHPGGDHTIFVGEIQAGGAREGDPLLWYHRGYRRLAD